MRVNPTKRTFRIRSRLDGTPSTARRTHASPPDRTRGRHGCTDRHRIAGRGHVRQRGAELRPDDRLDRHHVRPELRDSEGRVGRLSGAAEGQEADLRQRHVRPAGLERHPRGLRAGRPAVGLRPAVGQRRERPDGRHRRRLRRPDRGPGPGDVPVAVRRVGLHHRQRLLHQGEPERRQHPAQHRHRLGAGGVPRPRHGLRDRPNAHILLVEAPRRTTPNLVKAENEAAALGATEISNSYGGSEDSSETADELGLQPPGDRDHGLRR